MSDAGRFVIVPNDLRELIEHKRDAALLEAPGAAVDREAFYAQLLAFYDENGYVPDFCLQKKRYKEEPEEESA